MIYRPLQISSRCTRWKEIDAVAQVTKMGMVFVFDRVTGEPLFPIEERPVPASLLLGEEVWPTQPFPTKPLPFVRHNFSEDEVTNISPESNQFIRDKIKGARIGYNLHPTRSRRICTISRNTGWCRMGRCCRRSREQE